MTDERWRPVVGYEGYYMVSDLGRIQTVERWVRCRGAGLRLVRGRLRSTYVDKTSHGYLCVTLSRDGVSSKHGVHRLVLEAFVGPRDGDIQGCHNNGNRTDARLSNLRWDTPKGNQSDRVAHGTAKFGELNVRSKLTAELVDWIRDTRQSSIELAAILGVASSTIRAVRLRQNWRSPGAIA